MGNSERKTRNCLSFKEKFLIVEWLSNNAKNIELNKLTKAEAARRASTDLKFEISAHHMTDLTVGKNACVEVTWASSGPSDNVAARIAELDYQVGVLTQIVEKIAEWCRFMDEHGVPDNIKTQVQELMNRRSETQ